MVIVNFLKRKTNFHTEDESSFLFGVTFGDKSNYTPLYEAWHIAICPNNWVRQLAAGGGEP